MTETVLAVVHERLHERRMEVCLHLGCRMATAAYCLYQTRVMGWEVVYDVTVCRAEKDLRLSVSSSSVSCENTRVGARARARP